MQTINFLQEYETKTDEELLRLALESDQLTEDANQALSIVMRNRGITSEQRKRGFQQEEAEAENERAKDVGHLAIFHPLGIGRERYSKFDYMFDLSTGMERFITTIFIVIFWLPLVPIGTYRVERKKRFFLFSSKITVLEKLPLNWTQVLAVWATASVLLLGGYWALLLVLSRNPAHYAR